MTSSRWVRLAVPSVPSVPALLAVPAVPALLAAPALVVLALLRASSLLVLLAASSLPLSEQPAPIRASVARAASGQSRLLMVPFV